jgi:hypothetical protein
VGAASLHVPSQAKEAGHPFSRTDTPSSIASIASLVAKDDIPGKCITISPTRAKVCLFMMAAIWEVQETMERGVSEMDDPSTFIA